MIQEGEQTRLSAGKMGYLWATLASSYHDAADGEKALAAYEHALQLLRRDSADRANYATALDNLGALYLEYGRVAEAESVRKHALTIRKEIGDPLDVARSEEHIAEIALVKHRYKGAEKESRAAFEALSAAEGDGHAHVGTELSALVTLAYAECMQSKQEHGLLDAEKAMQLVKKAYPPGSVEQAHVLMALGFAQWKTGAMTEAERSMQDGLRIMREKWGATSPILMGAMFEYRDFLKATARRDEVAVIEKQLSGMVPRATMGACTGCVVSVYALR
jgi:tetratricopeptide (TPR) repeat protein